MRGPGNRVGFAGAGAVLDQVTLARPFGAGGFDELVDDIPLVIARENHRFFGGARAVEVFFGFLVEVQESAQYFEPGVGLEEALPEVAGGVLGVVLGLRVGLQQDY